MAFIDITVPTPRIVWRELERGIGVHDVNRDATHMTALLGVPAAGWNSQPTMQVRSWSLPDLVLRSRRVVNLDYQTEPELAVA